MNRPPRSRTVTLIAACATLALAASAAVGLGAGAAYAEDIEHIDNGTFDGTTAPWWATENTPLSVVDGQLCAEVPAGTANPWDASIGYSGIPLADGAPYRLNFTASASTPATVKANVQLNEAPYTTAMSRDVALTAEPREFGYEFTGNLDSTNGVFTFQLGGGVGAFTFCLDNVSLTSDTDTPPPAGGPEQISNGRFDEGTSGWFTYGTTSATVTDGRLCAEVPAGLANPWDAGVGQNGVPLVAGAEYTFSFAASADPPASIRAAVQLNEEPWTAALSETVAVAAGTATHTYTFTSPIATESGQVVLQIGGAAQAYTFCLDDVSLRGGEEEPPYTPDTGPRVRVNQVGYLPSGPKNATLVSAATEALGWQLKNSSGAVVANGQTTPRGVDAASGQNVHSIDFTAVTATGTGFTLAADGETSYPFDLSRDIYQRLRSDSLQFFYIQRSGIAIDGALVGEQYARPAGHVGVAPNKGDTDVPCQAGVCDYRLDVRGGWYDAGDHGKYVVNGGIAAYQLLNAFERTKTAASAAGGAALGDGTLRVPERGNGVPDILDEARWELEFLLRMQVPAGQPLAGMAHHKMHDANWTGLPLQPQDDPQQRELHPPSTAATLNLAATAAQCARLFAPYDRAFATRCLTAAKAAYAAAKANPNRLADPNDSTGGGSYADGDVSDEFYWAAAELYLTTGDQAYWTEVTASKHHAGDVFDSAGFGWGSTAALGRLDLATVASGITSTERARLRASVTAAADGYLATLKAQAYGLPMPGDAAHYFWGGNSNIINNAVVLATAFDLTGDVKYRDGAVQGMDYVFGRNALNHSYVSGWGEKASQNQHSRIFAHQLDENLPNPPAGSLAGGANAGLEDPYAKQLLSGCKPMFCYVDHIESYATNEVAVNWNSALAWIASFLADQGAGQPPAGRCSVTYTNYGPWPGGGGFTAQVAVGNTGNTPVNGWTLRFAFAGDQKVRDFWSARVSQSGATVTARNEAHNAVIRPGGRVTFGFSATSSGANPAPVLFTLNGAACR